MKVVFDTNCLLASATRNSPYYWAYKAVLDGRLTLCVTTEILEEYEEILSGYYSPLFAERVLFTIENLENKELITVYYKWELITKDRDDNKFVDCAIASNADYIVTHDRHFNVLKNIDFPKVNCITLQKLSTLL